jgi:hypothetical protein
VSKNYTSELAVTVFNENSNKQINKVYTKYKKTNMYADDH